MDSPLLLDSPPEAAQPAAEEAPMQNAPTGYVEPALAMVTGAEQPIAPSVAADAPAANGGVPQQQSDSKTTESGADASETVAPPQPAPATEAPSSTPSVQMVPTVTNKPSKTRKCCGESVNCGPATSWPTMALTWLGMLTPTTLFFVTVAPDLSRGGAPGLLAACVCAVVFMILAYLRIAHSNPGVVARNSRPPQVVAALKELTIEAAEQGLPPVMPVKLVINEEIYYYCATCNIYRKPGTFHCTLCEDCVVGLDHHCPWVGNCVATNNMGSFRLFQLMSAVASWALAAGSIVTIVFISEAPGAMAVGEWYGKWLVPFWIGVAGIGVQILLYWWQGDVAKYVKGVVGALSAACAIACSMEGGVPVICSVIVIMITLPLALMMTGVSFAILHAWRREMKA